MTLQLFGSGSASNQGMIQMDLPTLPLSSGKFGRSYIYIYIPSAPCENLLHLFCTQLSSFVTLLPNQVLYVKRVEIILKTGENRSFSCKSALRSGGQQKSPETAQSLHTREPSLPNTKHLSLSPLQCGMTSDGMLWTGESYHPRSQGVQYSSLTVEPQKKSGRTLYHTITKYIIVIAFQKLLYDNIII